MLVSDFDFHLPDELIAQQPPAERGGARMLCLDRRTGRWQDSQFREFPEMLRAGDVLVANNSRVIPARLFGRRVTPESSAAVPGPGIEILLTQQVGEQEWLTLARPARKLQAGDQIVFPGEDGRVALRAEVQERGEFGERRLRFEQTEDFFGKLEQVGHIPLPPYIHRPDERNDRERYQTVYADERGSVAAPTAGLHFTPEILGRIREGGVHVEYVTLHVGLGTFQPLRVARVDQVRLHSENYTLPSSTADAVNAAVRENRRVIAAGTTTVRTLEHCAQAGAGGELEPHSGSTDIFISPGYRFRVVSGLLTNFHLPQSSLLMLVSAFAGRDRVLRAYRHAVEQRYRFFSYGDCMFIV